jgi:hypothetical protein
MKGIRKQAIGSISKQKINMNNNSKIILNNIRERSKSEM